MQSNRQAGRKILDDHFYSKDHLQNILGELSKEENSYLATKTILKNILQPIA